MRQIEPKMVAYIDKKLENHGAAQDAIARKDARSLFIYVNEAMIGIREVGGNNSGAMVELIQETVGGHGREAWCMAFMMTGLAYCELKTGVKSPLFASEHCLTVWDKTPKSQRVKKIPAPGAIAIWRKGTSISGHTGVVIEWMGKTFEAVEGNTEQGINGGKVERDGGGVYRTIRNSVGTGNMKIVGFLKPF